MNRCASKPWTFRLAVVIMSAICSVCQGLLVPTSAIAQTNCRNEKTRGALPPFAPLPDIDISPDDRITPQEALADALKNCQLRDETKGVEYFERGIAALRRTKKYNKRVAHKLVQEYAVLLREHGGAEKAVQLEKEFRVKKSKR